MDGATPANLPVRILLHPRMHATATVEDAVRGTGEASFSGQRPQTTYFAHLNRHVIGMNLDATQILVEAILELGIIEDSRDSRVIFRDVPVNFVYDFIESYSFHENSELTPGLLNRYIDGQVAAGALTRWNVVVMGRRSPNRKIALGLTRQVPLITRSKLKPREHSTANIGTLMSKPDRVPDLPTATR